MRVRNLHGWALDYRRAVEVQHDLRRRLHRRRLRTADMRFVAGADVAVSKRLDRLVAAVVVLALPGLDIVERVVRRARPPLPYIPGLLSFREIPVLIRCFHSVRTPVDAVICDGHGIAHPRGVGLASHLGLLLEVPTIGCAKSRLVGEHDAVAPERGAFSALTLDGRRIGSVLRTQNGVNPVFVSPGHLADHAGARRLVLACAPRYRLPEPTRIADHLAGEAKRRLEARAA